MVEVGFYAPSHANQNRLRPDSLHNFACNGMWMVCTSILSRVVPKRFEAQPKEVNTSCPLQAAVTSNGLALQFASQTLKDDEEVVWCAVNQEQSMGFPWISLCLDFFWWTSLIDVEICLPSFFFGCSSARHHRMCSLDLIRPYLKHPFPGRKGPSFLNSCNFQFHINVGS